MITITHIKKALCDPWQSFKVIQGFWGYLNKSPLATWIHKIAGSFKRNDWGQERGDWLTESHTTN